MLPLKTICSKVYNKSLQQIKDSPQYRGIAPTVRAQVNCNKRNKENIIDCYFEVANEKYKILCEKQEIMQATIDAINNLEFGTLLRKEPYEAKEMMAERDSMIAECDLIRSSLLFDIIAIVAIEDTM